MHQEYTELVELLNFVRRTAGSEPKALCAFVKVGPLLAQRLAPLIALNVSDYTFAVDSYSLRHALTGHSQERGSRDQFPLFETDILALPLWLPAPPIMQTGNASKHPLQPRRLRFERPELAGIFKTVVVLEVRTGRKQLALVTMYKTKND